MKSFLITPSERLLPKYVRAIWLHACERVTCGRLWMETRWLCAVPRGGPCCCIVSSVLSRSRLTSSAGPLTSNAPLMADKLMWLGQAGQQMGRVYIRSSKALKNHPKKTVCASQTRCSKCRPAIFMRCEEETGFLVYGQSHKMSKILEWSQQQLVSKKKREKEDSCEVRNDKDRWKETGCCDVITFLQDLS